MDGGRHSLNRKGEESEHGSDVGNLAPGNFYLGIRPKGERMRERSSRGGGPNKKKKKKKRQTKKKKKTHAEGSLLPLDHKSSLFYYQVGTTIREESFKRYCPLRSGGGREWGRRTGVYISSIRGEENHCDLWKR